MKEDAKKEEKPVEPKPKTPQEFAEAYSKLCEEYGFRINVSPQFMARDDGTFSVVLNHSVGQLPQNN